MLCATWDAGKVLSGGRDGLGLEEPVRETKDGVERVEAAWKSPCQSGRSGSPSSLPDSRVYWAECTTIGCIYLFSSM